MDQKTTTWVIVGIIILVIIGGIWWYTTQSPVVSQEGTTVTPAGNTTTEENSTGSTATTGGTAMTLEQAQKAYVGRRVQFNEACVTIPTTPTFKDGTTIMLENGANVAKNISLAGQTYNLKAHGYVIVKLPVGGTLPRTLLIDCGAGQNNGSILLQN